VVCACRYFVSLFGLIDETMGCDIVPEFISVSQCTGYYNDVNVVSLVV
jgi:peroxiredoxin family protein